MDGGEKRHVGARGRKVIARRKHKTGNGSRVIKGKSEGDQRAPGVPHDDGPLDAKARERFSNQRGLRYCRPGTAARALAMAKPRPVEGNGPVLPGGMIDHAADQHVIDHRAVAVKKHDRPAAPAHEIVKPHAVRGDERSFWRMLALGFSGAAVHEDGGPGQGKSRHAEDAALALCRAGAWHVCSEGVFQGQVRSSFALVACANEATLARGPTSSKARRGQTRGRPRRQASPWAAP